jgi:hypothetical protein
LLEIWEAAVRATHDFLTEADIDALLPQVRAYVSAAPFELAVTHPLIEGGNTSRVPAAVSPVTDTAAPHL